MANPTLKGSGMSATLMNHFTTFDAFYEWGKSRFEGKKSEFESVYKKYHPNYDPIVTTDKTK